MNILKSYRCLMSILIVLAVVLILITYLLTRSKDSSFTMLLKEKRLLDHVRSLVYSNRTQSNPLLDFIPSYKWAEFQMLNLMGKLRLLVKEKASMKDPRLIDLIRKYYIEFPSEKPYAFTIPTKKDYSCGQSSYVDSLLNSEERGFFVEAGAWLGEHASTSLFFEKSRGWTGLLVEPNPENFLKLKSLNRKAFHINACLSTHPFPTVLMLNAASDMSRTIEKMEDKQWVQEHNFDQKPYYEVPCFPLYSIMLAINRTSIDYFGLDVEGNEFQILETIPFDDLYIKIMTTECLEMNGRGKESTEAVKIFLERKGYRCHGIIGANPQHSCFAEDLVFIKEDLVSHKNKCELITSPFGSNDTLHIGKRKKNKLRKHKMMINVTSVE